MGEAPESSDLPTAAPNQHGDAATLDVFAELERAGVPAKKAEKSDSTSQAEPKKAKTEPKAKAEPKAKSEPKSKADSPPKVASELGTTSVKSGGDSSTGTSEPVEKQSAAPST